MIVVLREILLAPWGGKVILLNYSGLRRGWKQFGACFLLSAWHSGQLSSWFVNVKSLFWSLENKNSIYLFLFHIDLARRTSSGQNQESCWPLCSPPCGSSHIVIITRRERPWSSWVCCCYCNNLGGHKWSQIFTAELLFLYGYVCESNVLYTTARLVWWLLSISITANPETSMTKKAVAKFDGVAAARRWRKMCTLLCSTFIIFYKGAELMLYFGRSSLPRRSSWPGHGSSKKIVKASTIEVDNCHVELITSGLPLHGDIQNGNCGSFTTAKGPIAIVVVGRRMGKPHV